MERLIFNETNIFILSKLVSMVKKETGIRHKLSSEVAVTTLLIEVADMPQESVSSLYHRFLENLTPEQIHELKGRGVGIPEHLMKKRGIFPTHIPRQYAFIPQ